MREKEGILRAIVQLDDEIFRLMGIKHSGYMSVEDFQAVIDFNYSQREKLKKQLSEITD